VLLEDSNGRAIWALGYFILHGNSIHKSYIWAAEKAIRLTFPNLSRIKSPRSIAFAIKGLYYYFMKKHLFTTIVLVCTCMLSAFTCGCSSKLTSKEKNSFDKSVIADLEILNEPQIRSESVCSNQFNCYACVRHQIEANDALVMPL
jgi:hypothetical protein